MSEQRSSQEITKALRMTRAAKLAVAEEICRMRLDSDERMAREAPRIAEFGSEWLMNEFETLQAAWLSTSDGSLVSLAPVAPEYKRWLDPVAEAREADALEQFKAARRGGL